MASVKPLAENHRLRCTSARPASAAAFAMAVAAGGACKDVRTTPLLSIAEGLEAVKKAESAGYKPVTARK